VTADPDRIDAIFACGVSAGTVWSCLRDLADKADRLPPGGLKDTWVRAANEMMTTLDEAQQVATLG
jgi:hypothetical protein